MLLHLRELGRAIAQQRWVRVVLSVIDNLDKHDAPRAASAIAFDAFLSLIPLVALVGHVLSRLHQSSELFLGPLIRAAPVAVSEAVTVEIQRMSDSSVVAPLGIAFVWVSSSGLSTAMGVFETIYGSTARSWYHRRAIAAGCVLASLVGFPGVAMLGVLLATISGSVGAQVVAVALPASILVLAVAVFFRIAIAERPGLTRPVLPGAALTVVLWVAVSVGFSLYVAKLARYTTLYGTLATAAIFLFWLWLLALALFVGGELNARLERERTSMVPDSIGRVPFLGRRSLPPPPGNVDDDHTAPPSVVTVGYGDDHTAPPGVVRVGFGSEPSRDEARRPTGSDPALRS
ncbi:YihY/virulence factor BrkB family protein [Chondromyces apiculatus]|uniref:Uncharacterized protein n=1 Tax=Chondromyces apiculatus DSM 436 TaxID=1192034 RepID=A0A017SWZ5_9BACT|nr:YihY/virulence factor BrkB family protein [Chondromyces apiculatus]EYF01297.1 Hypothetical protein CAP_8451 [Chondromyces apiculatus DSM 436]